MIKRLDHDHAVNPQTAMVAQFKQGSCGPVPLKSSKTIMVTAVKSGGPIRREWPKRRRMVIYLNRVPNAAVLAIPASLATRR